MSKTSIALLLILLFTTGLYLFFSATPKKNPMPSFPRNIPSPAAAKNISLSLQSIPVTAGQNAQVAVQIFSPTTKLNLIQLEIEYEPLEVTVIGILPGSYFKNPVVLLNTINPKNGRISYALTCQTSNCINQNATTAVTLIFSSNPYALKKETTVQLLPKSLMRTTNEEEILIKQSRTSLKLTPIATQSSQHR